MARSRNIKPGFFTNEELAEMPFENRLLFIGIWCIADKSGRLEFRPKRIKAQIFPYDDVNVMHGLCMLHASSFIVFYKVDGKIYIQICNWDKHQSPHHKEVESQLPAYDNNNIINDLSMHESCTSHACVKENVSSPLIPDSLNLIPDSGFSDSLIPDSIVSPSAIAVAKTPANKKQSSPAKVIPISRDTWQAYSNAYFDRYGAAPVNNAKINGQIVQFIKRIGETASPHIAAFYLTHNNSYYVRAMHPVDYLLRDAEKLHTEWTTRTQMTSTKAMQTDKTQTNFDSFSALIAEAEERERHAQ